MAHVRVYHIEGSLGEKGYDNHGRSQDFFGGGNTSKIKKLLRKLRKCIILACEIF